MTNKENLGGEVYGGLAGFGKVMAVIGAVVMTIIGIGMVIGGIIALVHKAKRTATALGKIIGVPTCSANINEPNFSDCTFFVKFSDGSKEHTEEIQTSNSVDYRLIFAGGDDTVNVYYDPKNPSDVSLQKDNTQILGWVLLVVGLIFIILSWLWVWITRRSKMAAAAGGAVTIFDMFKGN